MDSTLVVVASYATAAEAELVRGILAEEGIPSSLADQHLLTVDPWVVHAVGPVTLRVERSRAAAAEAILARLAAEAAAAREAAADGEEGLEDSCLSCGVPFPEYLDRCPACGLSYA